MENCQIWTSEFRNFCESLDDPVWIGSRLGANPLDTIRWIQYGIYNPLIVVQHRTDTKAIETVGSDATD